MGLGTNRGRSRTRTLQEQLPLLSEQQHDLGSTPVRIRVKKSELCRGCRVASTNQGLNYRHVTFSVTAGKKNTSNMVDRSDGSLLNPLFPFWCSGVSGDRPIYGWRRWLRPGSRSLCRLPGCDLSSTFGQPHFSRNVIRMPPALV